MATKAVAGSGACGDALPPGWRWVRLGDHVLKVGSGITPTGGQASYVPQGIPLIRSQNVHMNRFAYDGLAYITAKQDAEMEGSRVQRNDVLLNITGASIGRVSVVPDDLCPANVNQHVSIIRLDSSLSPHFLAYYISSPAFQKFITDSQAGATRQALTKALIENFRIPTPPLDEQQRIAAVLQDQVAAVERARAAAEVRLEAAGVLPAVYLRSVFEQGRIADWASVRLGEVAELLPSKSISSTGDAEVRAITTACLSERGFLPAGVKQALMWKSDAEECKVTTGEVLVARSNTPELVGRVSMYAGEPPDVVASDLTIRIWPSDRVTSPFLAVYLSYLHLTDYWKKRAGGASGSMKKITREQIKALRIPIPPAETQNRICKTLAERMSSVACLRAALEVETAAIDSLSPALLRRAFHGGF